MIEATISRVGAAPAAFAVTVDRKALVAAMKLACKVIERRNTIPILSNVLLRVCPAGILSIHGTDLDIMISEEVPSAYGEPGSVTVEAKALANVIGKSKAESVRLSDVGGGKLSVVDCATGQGAKLPTLSVADYPVIAFGDKVSATMALDAAELRRDWTRVRPAISTEETRYYLNGIFAHVATEGGDKVLRYAATDGHRLMRCTRPLPEGAEAMPDVIIPRKLVNLIVDVIGPKSDRWLNLDVTETKVRARIGRVVITSKVIDGTFPDYSRVIPTMNDRHRLEVSGEKLGEAVKAATAHCSDKCRAVKLSIAYDYVIASATDATNGVAALVIDGAHGSEPDGLGRVGEPLAIGCNAKYLADMADAFPGDFVALFADEAAPIRIESPDTPELLGVLMPMRDGGGIYTPADVAKLHQSPAERFREDATAAIATANEEGVYPYARKAAMKRLGAAVKAYRESLPKGREIGLQLAEMVAEMQGDMARAERARIFRAVMFPAAVEPAANEPAENIPENIPEPPACDAPVIDNAACVTPEGDSAYTSEPTPAPQEPQEHSQPESAVMEAEPAPCVPEPVEAEDLTATEGDGESTLAELVAEMADRVARLETMVDAPARDDRAKRLRIVRRYLAMRQERDGLRQAAANLCESISVANRELAEANGKAVDAGVELADERQKRITAGERLEAADLENQRLTGELAMAREETSRLRQAADGFRTELDRVEGENVQLRADISRRPYDREELKLARTEIARLGRLVETMERRLAVRTAPPAAPRPVVKPGGPALRVVNG